MNACRRGGRLTAGGISAVLLLGGCTGSAPSDGNSSATASPIEAAAPLACDRIGVRDVEVEPGDWALAESVLVRGSEGTRLTVTMSPSAPAGIALGGSPEPGSAETRSEGLTVERATVTTDPPSDLDPATLQAALGPVEGEPMSLSNAGQPGFTSELKGEVRGDGTVAYRGAREMAVTFTGTCSSPSGEEVPVTGSARYFGLAEAGLLDCGTSVSVEPGILAELAAEACTIE